MVNVLYGKKFFLKMCTRCGKQFTDEKEFESHIKLCGSSVFKDAKRANTVQDVKSSFQNKKENNLDLNKNAKVEEGFEQLDKVTDKIVKPVETLQKEMIDDLQKLESNTIDNNSKNIENVLQEESIIEALEENKELDIKQETPVIENKVINKRIGRPIKPINKTKNKI